jgi:hypothetical protein
LQNKFLWVLTKKPTRCKRIGLTFE